MSRSTPSRVTRRTFLEGTVAAGGVLAAMAALPKAEAAVAEKVELEPGSVVLFQGDSITDAGRNRKSSGPNNWAGLT